MEPEEVKLKMFKSLGTKSALLLSLILKSKKEVFQ